MPHAKLLATVVSVSVYLTRVRLAGPPSLRLLEGAALVPSAHGTTGRLRFVSLPWSPEPPRAPGHRNLLVSSTTVLRDREESRCSRCSAVERTGPRLSGGLAERLLEIRVWPGRPCSEREATPIRFEQRYMYVALANGLARGRSDIARPGQRGLDRRREW